MIRAASPGLTLVNDMYDYALSWMWSLSLSCFSHWQRHLDYLWFYHLIFLFILQYTFLQFLSFYQWIFQLLLSLLNCLYHFLFLLLFPLFWHWYCSCNQSTFQIFNNVKWKEFLTLQFFDICINQHFLVFQWFIRVKYDSYCHKLRCF